MNPRIKDLGEASRALEATLVKQLLESSGAFKGTGVAGSQLNAQMFMEVLADAVAKDGGFGLAKMLEKSLGSGDKEDAAAPKPPGVTSDFGARLHPIDNKPSFHTGLDLAAPAGTAILAAKGGTVVSAGERGGYGNAVEIDHGDGLRTLYAHARVLDVRQGDTVAPGEKLGEVGATGKTTGPHLHFEVRFEGKPIDPRKALNAYGIRAEATVEESRKQASLLP